MATRRPGRLARRFALAAGCLVLFDLGAKALLDLRQPAPEGAPAAAASSASASAAAAAGAPAEPWRIPSAEYHHDLAPCASGMATWGAERYPFATNSLGLRDGTPRQVELAPRPPRRRTLIMGDSFAEGIGVPWSATFAGRLAALAAARGEEVLNAGVCSYAPVIHRRKLAHLLERGLEVDRVVVLIDLSDPADELGYALEGQRVVAVPAPPPPPGPPPGPGPVGRFMVRRTLIGAAVWRGWRRLTVGSSRSLGAVAERTRQRSGWTEDPELAAWVAPGLASCERHMSALAERCRARGLPLTVVVYPAPVQLQAGVLDSLQVRRWRAWCQAQQAAFVDLFPPFLEAGPPAATYRDLFIPGDVHWNAEGHRLVAEALAPVLFPPG